MSIFRETEDSSLPALSLLLLQGANNSILLSFQYRLASPLWAMETCTQRPIWAGFLPSSASLLGLSSMGCQFPFSTTNSPITTASSRLMSTLPYEGKGERWSSCNEPERRRLSVWLEATCSLLQGKRINVPEDACG